jgi:hypothetical protein
VLTRAIDDADVDLDTQLSALVAARRLAITSYLGLTLTIPVDGHPVSVTAYNAATTRAATSLLIPLTPDPNAATSSTLTLYAATSGALDDLAADLGYALDLPHTALIFNKHLSEPSQRSGVTGRDTHAIVNQAIGILLERGNTLEAARAQLRTGALGTGDQMRIAAEHVLHRALREPQDGETR